MAKGSVNKVILVGNLGRDPEMRYTPNGVAVATFSMATTEMWKDKQSGQMVEQTEWHRISAFARLAEIMGEYLRKGSKVYIEGRLRTNKWQDKTTGQDRYSTEIVADNMQMLDSKGGSGAGTPPDMNQAERSHSSAMPEPSSAAPADSFDDDIPF